MSRRRPGSVGPYALAAALMIGAAFGFNNSAAAQVLEISEDGAVTVHDRPAVFEAGGAKPIETAEPAPPAAPAAASLSYTMAALSEAALASHLSPELVEAVAWRESRLRAGVVSRAGAIGEMQLMPGTARELGVNPYDTRQNLHGGARYLSGMLRRYNGDLVLALAAYNAGPGAVDRYRGVPPYRETREYVTAVLERLGQRAAAGQPER
jgi:soluble lytic murein transglycosylase-like protein